MIFAGVSALAFTLALAGFIWVRVYDRELIRQTESELIAQGAAVASIYRAYLLETHPPSDYGFPATAAWPFPRPDDVLSPILPSLRAGDEVYPSSDDPMPASAPADEHARAAGTRVAPLLSEISRTTLAALRVVNPDAIVVASSKLGLGATLAARAEVQKALRGEPNSLLRARDVQESSLGSLSREAGVRVTVALPVLSDGRVLGAIVLSRTPMTPAKALYADRWNLAATALLLLGMLALVSAGVGAWVVRPVRALVRQTREIAAQAPAGFAPLQRPVVAEVAELSEAFAAMAGSLRDRNDYLRSFAANVSHEFKTPLAAILGAVELLKDSGDAMPPEQRARFLDNVEQDAQRLTRLTQSLLELARADAMPSSAAVFTPVGPLLAALRARCEKDGFALALEGANPDAERAGVPAEVLESVLTQLLLNARQHGGGQRAWLRVEPQGRELALAVRDDGGGISEANRARIFDAFFTTARDRGGTGMGLTIARSLLRAFGGRLELAPAQPGEGARFVLTVPRA